MIRLADEPCGDRPGQVHLVRFTTSDLRETVPRSREASPHVSTELPDGQLADDTPSWCSSRARSEEEQGDRANWPWLPGTIVQQVGPDEWQVCVEDMAVAVRKDGSSPPRARRRTGCTTRWPPRRSEIKLRDDAR